MYLNKSFSKNTHIFVITFANRQSNTLMQPFTKKKRQKTDSYHTLKSGEINLEALANDGAKIVAWGKNQNCLSKIDHYLFIQE